MAPKPKTTTQPSSPADTTPPAPPATAPDAAASGPDAPSVPDVAAPPATAPDAGADAVEVVVDPDAPHESNGSLDEPDPEPGPTPMIEGEVVVGAFVAFGVEQVSRVDGEWLVDPETGCITGPA